MFETAKGYARRFAIIAAEARRRTRLSSLGSLAVALQEATSIESAVSGSRFAGSVAGVKGSQTFTTSFAQIGGWLWNGEPQGGGDSYIIEMLTFGGWTAPILFGPVSMLVAVTTSPILQPASASIGVVSSLSGASMGSKAVLAVSTGAGTFPSIGAFCPIASRKGLAGVTSPGTGEWTIPIDGRIVLPPGHALAFLCLGLQGNDTYVVGAQWTEVPLDLE